jgi:hypothetical protein
MDDVKAAWQQQVTPHGELQMLDERLWVVTATGGLPRKLFNLPHQPGFVGWLFKTLGSTGFFGMTGIARMFILQDRAAFKRWLAEQACRDDLRLIGVSHGDAVTADCQAKLQAASDRL